MRNVTVSGIPKNEMVWETVKNEKGEAFFITSKEKREEYLLYKKENGKVQKIAKAKTPIKLYEKI